jgi:hypothetical protein
LRTLVYAIIALVVVGIAAVLIGPSFVNWTAYKGDIARRLSETTGHEVVIRGEVGVDMLPRPRVSVEDVRVANVADGTAENLARVAAIRVDVRFAPLLQGDVRLARVTLVEPRLSLERLTDGGWNWRKAARQINDASGTPDARPLGANVRVETIHIDNGEVVYRDQRHGRTVTLERVNGRVTADGARGPFDATGSFVWRNTKVRGSARAGRFGARGGTPFAVTLHPQGATGKADIGVSGTLSETAPIRANAELNVSGNRGARLLQAMGVPARLSATMRERSYSANAKLAVDGRVIDASALDVTIGDVGLSGDLTLTAGPPMRIDGDINLQRVNLDRFVHAPDTGKITGKQAVGGDGKLDLHLPRRVRGAITVTASALVYREQVIRQSRIALQLNDEQVRLTDARALLPGGSEVRLSGDVSAPDGTPRFAGRIEAESNNLRSVFDWLGVRVRNVSQDRLRRLDLTAKLRVQPGRLTFSEMDLGVDTLTVRGGLVVVPSARPGLGVGVRVDRLDLDSYWRTAEARPRDEPSADGGNLPRRRAILDRFDANFDVRVGTLIAGGRHLQEARVKGALRQGTLTLETLRAEAVAGGPLRVDGRIEKVTAAKPTFDLNVAWQDVRPRAATTWLDVHPGVPAGWPAVSVSGQVSGTPANLRVNLALQALDGLMTANGKVTPGTDGPLPGADLRVALQHDSLRQLLGAFTKLPPVASDPGAVDLSAGVRSTDAGIEARNLKGTLGDVKLSGGAKIQLADPRPHLALTLDTGTIPLSVFAPASPAGDADNDAGDWSAAPLGLSVLRRVDGNLALRADALRLDGLAPVKNARIAATLTEGALTLNKAAGRWGGGSARLTGTLNAAATPTLEATIDLADVDAAAVQPAIAGVQLGGPISVNGMLSARGRSERALIETLTGEGHITGAVRLRPTRTDETLLRALFGGTLDDAGNIARAAERADRAFRDVDAPVTGTWRVTDGTLRSEDLAVQGDGMTASLSGQANLPDWRADLRLQLRGPKGDGDAPFLDATLQGALDTPTVQLAGSGLSIDQPSGPADPSGPTAPAAPAAPGETRDDAASGSKTANGNGPQPDANSANAGSAKAGTGENTDDTGTSGGKDKVLPTAEDVIRDLLKELPKQVQ